MIATTDLTKAAALAIGIALVSIICWEMYLRSKAFKPAYDDGPELWSYTRKKVYQPADKAVVFIGSSRIKYDLDIGTWKSITGIDAIQLAIEGNS
ncbi:MAG: hypothetical protein ABIO05_06935, partial [Ferruginibacter sp.]